jgi:hypothetical protein
MNLVSPATDRTGCHLIVVSLSELCGPHGSRYARGVYQIGALIPGAAIVTVGDPDHLAILEASSR